MAWWDDLEVELDSQQIAQLSRLAVPPRTSGAIVDALCEIKEGRQPMPRLPGGRKNKILGVLQKLNGMEVDAGTDGERTWQSGTVSCQWMIDLIEQM